MILYFIVGFIAGVVGTFMFLRYIGRKIEEAKQSHEV